MLCEDFSTADIGTGLIWDDVYAALEPFGVNVPGGRVSGLFPRLFLAGSNQLTVLFCFQGIGMAGFTLGGGTSMCRDRETRFTSRRTHFGRLLVAHQPTRFGGG